MLIEYIKYRMHKRKLRKIIKQLDNWEWNDYDENGIPYWAKTGLIDPDDYNRRDGEIHPSIEREMK